MLYTIYKITNKINNKFYIGMHKTNNLDDGYMGSGKLIKSAINKYGIENFIKEILHVFDNEDDMKNKEKELVILNEMSYNLCEGGKGGFGYINTNKLQVTEKQKSAAREHLRKMKNSFTEEHRSEITKKAHITRKKNGSYPSHVANHLNTPEISKKSGETRKLIGSQKGSKNSQYGKPRSLETRLKIAETLRQKKIKNVVTPA